MKTAIELIAAERERQMSVEGWTPEHDDTHTGHDLIHAAMAYANEGLARQGSWLNYPRSEPGRPHPDGEWPWEPEAWKPSEDSVRNLVKSAALLAAEIDRLLRNAAPEDAAQGDAQPTERWTYHYSAVHSVPGGTCHTDGIATISAAIRTWEDYMAVKRVIISKFKEGLSPVTPDELTITSLSLLEYTEL